MIMSNKNNIINIVVAKIKYTRIQINNTYVTE